jgi:hypothetical protein
MLMPLIFGLLCWLFALAVLAFGIAWLFSTGALDLLFAGKKYRAFVLEHSVTLKKIRETNQKYSFRYVSSGRLDFTYDNENYYRMTSEKDCLIYKLAQESTDFRADMEAAEYNKRLFRQYMTEIQGCMQLEHYDAEVTVKNRPLLSRVEKGFVDESILKPKTAFCALVVLQLTNLQGYSRAYKKQSFGEGEIKLLIARVNDKSGNYYRDREIWDAICRVERGKVTNKMRFAVYQRDHYRCRKCGRSTNDLEIDHIFPISKGGKSTFDNLQTLCHNCNYAKSNRVEYHRAESRYDGFADHGYCPHCGKKLQQRIGKYGVFYGCPNFPKCTYVRKR